MTIRAINPATGAVVAEYQPTPPAEARQAIRAAHAAHLAWRKVPFDGRATVLREAARILRADAPSYAKLMTDEMGKPVSGGVSEAEKCAWVCDYYAEHAERFLAPEVIATDATRSFVAFEPLGVVLAIMPWNFPFWQVFRFAAPALMAGNAGILKHASNVPGCALAIEDVFRRAGLPDGLFRTLLVDNKVAAGLIRTPLVRAVTLTGSTAAGRSVARAAGAKLKKCVLELGGSDPYLILRGRGPRPGGGDLRHQPVDQRRPELHRGQAVHRGGVGPRGVRAPVRRADAGDAHGRSHRSRHRGGSDGAAGPP